MEKTIKLIILMLAFLFVTGNKSIAQYDALSGDLGIVGNPNYTITAAIEIVSVPFEGITNPKSGYGEPLNRVGKVQNGIYWRFFQQSPNPLLEYDMAYLCKTEKTYGMIFDIGHCSGTEFPESSISYAWGFAKYKITIHIAETSEKYQLYLNSLDSKYGMVNAGGYGRDLYFDYKSNLPESRRLVFLIGYNQSVAGYDTVATWDTLSNGKPSKEYKLWEVILNQGNPMEKNFFTRTTPFPVSPRVIFDNKIRELELGTKVIFDTVYSYTGLTDRKGYNTIDSPTVFNAYYSNPPIPEGLNSIGNTFVSPAYFYYDNNYNEIVGIKINVLQGDTVILKSDKRLWISGYVLNSENGDTLILASGSVVTKETGAKLNTCRGGTIIDYGATMNWSQNSSQKAYFKSEFAYLGNQHTINNGGYIEIDGNARLKLGDNTTVTFDGAGTYLKLNPNSIVQLGNNAKIEFKNGAKLIADGSSFAAAPNSIWKGLYFENSGIDDIQNCTFSGAEYPIDIKCENSNSALVLKTIKNNTFNLTGTGKTAIKTNNAINLLIDDNTINMPSDLSNTPAIYLRNALSFSPNPGNSEEITNIRVVNNNINNGSNSIIIANYVSTFLPVYVDNNICYNSFSSPFIGRFITGTISNNNFDNENKIYGKGAVIHQGNPGLFRNNIFSKDVALSLLSGASVNMSPSGDGSNQLLWTGGENDISSTVSHSINFNQNSMANIDFGHNDFYKQDAASSHLYGSLLIQGTVYYARENCWYNTNYPVYNLVNNQGNQVNVIWQGGYYNCIDGISQIDSVMIDWGAGIYQYVPVSNLGQQQVIDQDELLYGQAVQQASIGSYPSAINLLKQLINDYQSSQYLSTALFDLYAYYEELDTTQSEGERDILYGNLKTYLNDRILTELYDEQFESDAFYIIVMCEANMMNTQLAIDDYEFLSLYHPQPEVRLLASWDYTELEALYGQGGSIKEFKSEDEMTQYIDLISKKIENKFKGDPLRNRLMKTYKKVNDEYYSKEEIINKELSRAGNIEKENIMTKKAELDNRKEMNRTASTNL
ncbi:MAG: hypothetical protein JW917_09235, partial [Ignavibacteria bacterium]|nr:hypothetical protein [Ignavibacteria bacterium]